MDLGFAVTVFRNAVFQILLLSAPILIISMVVGLVISIFQATTSIQEQTLSFVPKLAAIMIALIFLGPWMMGMLSDYTIQLFQQIPQVAR